MPLAERYILTLNAEQARVIQEALELLARIHMGQFDHVSETVCPDWDGHPYPDHYRELEDKLRQAVFSQKCERCDGTGKWSGDPGQPCGFCEAGYAPLLNPNAFYGIDSPKRPDEARVAWDLYTLVRHRLAWDRLPDGKKPPGIPLVMYDDPTTLSKQPRATIEGATDA